MDKSKPMPPGKRKALAAARTLFAKQGYEKTTTQQIADLAGVSQATVFKYFSTKDGLLDAIFEGLVEDSTNGIFEKMAAVTTVEDLVQLVVTDRLTFFQDHYEEIRIMLQEYLTNSAKYDKFKQILEIAHQAIERAVANIRQHDTSLNPEMTVADILRTIIGFIGSYILQGYSVPLTSLPSKELLEKQLLRSLTVD